MDKLIVGYAPTILGEYDIVCPEMMFVQDMPVIMPGSDLRLPKILVLLSHYLKKIQYSAKADYVYVSCKKHVYHCTKSWPVRGGIWMDLVLTI